MNMEQKTFYVAPEAKLSAARIRCSILVGSNGQGQTSQEGGQDARPSTPPFEFGDARARKGSLSF